MDSTPLASLSLTHVHYVHPPIPLPFPHSPSLSPPISPTNPPTEPLRPPLLPLRLARPPPPSPLHNLLHPNLLDPRNRSPLHVRRTNGLRGVKFRVEARY